MIIPSLKTWVITPRSDNDLITHLLTVRGVTDAEAFLRPSFDRHQHDPFSLPGMEKAVETLVKAIKEGECIGLFGDYDCDGIPGTALLYQGLTAVGANVAVFIPKRADGYGLSKSGIDQLKELGAKVIITIDNGTTALDQIVYAQSIGMKVIVTDHHEPGSNLPECIIINPKLPASKYPFHELCGTSVVYKLLEALANEFANILDARWFKWHLDLVALATICDMVPLVGENRLFASYGLIVLPKTHNIGLRALSREAGLSLEKISPYDVGFKLGPRINALGRMDEDPMLAFELLVTDEPARAEQLASVLQQHNQVRQSSLITAMLQAEAEISANNWDAKPAIVLKNQAWGVGIVGLIASKLVEKYHRPVFIFADDGKSIKGSARSIEQFPLPENLALLQSYLDSFGGHAMAAGMSIKDQQYDGFMSQLLDLAKDKLSAVETVPHIHIDAEISLDQINNHLIQQLSSLEPHGLGNKKPRFAVRDIVMHNLKSIGDGKHMRGVAMQDKTTMPFVAFNLADHLKQFPVEEPADMVVSIEQNTWNGRTTNELSVQDARKE